MPHGRTFRYNVVNAGMLKETSAIHELIYINMAYKFLKQEDHLHTGSSSCMNKLAMMHYIGIPTGFLSISAAEFYQPEILQTAGIQYDKHFTDEDMLNLNWKTKSTYLCSSLMTAARMLQD